MGRIVTLEMLGSGSGLNFTGSKHGVKPAGGGGSSGVVAQTEVCEHRLARGRVGRAAGLQRLGLRQRCSGLQFGQVWERHAFHPLPPLCCYQRVRVPGLMGHAW
ncbi:MAG: hypothetical protein CMM02_14200 [Rhodopirellula sp.]|nr:hypothetical protein [Rhodopirellula sp.]